MAAQAWVQIASVDTHDSSACVILGTRHERFMFNVGEGTQRSSMEHGIRVSKLEHVFLTHLSSDTLGGLPGLLLTLADVRSNNLNVHDGVIRSGSEPGGSSAAAVKAAKGGRQGVTAARSPEGAVITLHGPPGLAEFYRATWHFIRREDFPVVVDAVTEDANRKFRHEELDVIPIPVVFAADGESKPLGATTNVEPSPVTPPADEKEAEELPPAAKRAKREGTGRGSGGSAGPGEGERRVGCVCYVCEVPPLPGKFDVKKAVELGVPMGPEFGNLQKGHDVKLKDGTVIKPSQVLGPPRFGSRAIIVACPSVELLPSLVSHPDWERFYSDDIGGNGGGGRGGGGNGDNEKPSPPPCIVHLAPEGVLRSRQYGEWARRFGSGATHIVTTRPFCPQHSIFQAAHDQAARLNRVCGAAFALPKQFTDDLADDAATNGVTGLSEPRLIAPEELNFGGKVVSGVPLMKFELLQTSKRPQLDTLEALTWERSQAISERMLRSLKAPRIFPSPSRHAGLAESMSSSGGAGAAAAASNASAGAFAAAAAPDSEVVFFGTGSAMPSKYRNVTGMLVRLIAGEHDGDEAGVGAGANGTQTTAAPGSAAAPSGGSGEAGIMLDAGEGTMGQMWRIFGDGSDNCRSGSDGGENSESSSSGGGTQQILRNLAAVWISHPHADHHLGLVRILSERNKLLGFDGGVGSGGVGVPGDTVAKGDLSKVKGAAGAGVATFPKLLLMGPAPVAAWLKEYGNIDPTVRGGYDFLDASHMQAGDTAPRPPPHVASAARQALARAGVLRATSVRVRHCANAYALVLTVAASAAAKAASKASAANGEGSTRGAGVAMRGIRGTGKDWKLVYSGDCRPSEALVREGKGAAVLIHEATFDESKQQEAYAKSHSTIPEALGVGQRMCAEQVILTHFSQRYPHMPTGIVGAVGSNVCLAFDFMRVRLSDLSWLSRRSAALAAAVTPDAEARSTSPQGGRRSRKTPPEKKRTVAPSSRRLPPSPLLAGGQSPISWAAVTAAATESGVGGSVGGAGSTSSVGDNNSGSSDRRR